MDCNIKETTDLFVNIYNEADKWGWEDWERETIEEEVTYALNIKEELEKFYIFLCLKSTLNNKTELPYSFELTLITESLIEIVDNIREDTKKWDMLTENDMLKFDLLVNLLSKAKDKQQTKEAETIRNAFISQKKVKMFKEGVKKTIETLKRLKYLIKHFNAIKYSVEISEQVDRLEYNKLFEKNWFIDREDLNIIWEGLDEVIAQNIVNVENNCFIRKFYKAAQTVSKEDIGLYLNSIDLNTTAIIFINSQAYDFFEAPNDAGVYIANWEGDFSENWLNFPQGIAGVLQCNKQLIPVYEYFNNFKWKAMLIIDFNNVELIQYNYNVIDTKKSVNYLEIDVHEVRAGSIEEDDFISNPPEWLKEIGDENAQRHYIEEKVIIKIYEQFYLSIGEEAIAKIPLE